MLPRLLTIQDISCVGQCSLTVALPLISACGVECAVLPAAVLSNHTGGFSGWTFRDLTEDLAKVEAEWRRQDIRFDAFYTGYVCPAQIDPILSVMAHCAQPGARRFVDPAMADNGVLYKGFPADFPNQMARLCRDADYLLPNLTEAALLLGRKPVLEGYDADYVTELCTELRTLGAKNVVLTGVSFDPGELGSAVFDGTSVTYDFNPREPRQSHGTGDVFAAVFAAAVMRGRTAAEAAAIAADTVCAAIRATPPDHWYGVAFEKTIAGLSAAFPS